MTALGHITESEQVDFIHDQSWKEQQRQWKADRQSTLSWYDNNKKKIWKKNLLIICFHSLLKK